MSDLTVIAGTSWANYRAVNRGWVLLTGVFPRALVQVAFYLLLAQTLPVHPSAAVSLMSGSAFVATRSTVVNATSILMIDVSHGTLDGTRLGRRGLPTVALVRSWIWVAEGAATAACAFLLLGLCALGPRQLSSHLPALGVIALVSVTSVPLGLIVAALGLLRRIETLISNLVTYLLLLASGALTAAPAAWLARVGAFLPLTNGVRGLWNSADGSFPWAAAGREALTGAVWLVVAILVVRLVERHLRRTGESAS